MYNLLKNFLFKMDAEKAHHFTTSSLRLINKLGLLGLIRRGMVGSVKNTATTVMGLRFRNGLGMAAGFDKNAEYLDELDKLGFGSVEIGTVTPMPQDGNPLPRLFRLPKDTGLINRMGFNNQGVEAAANRIRVFRKKRPASDLIIGGNIGKNKVTPNQDAHLDYEKCFVALYDLVDYVVVNVSSPNTPNLRELQDKEALGVIFQTLRNAQEQMKDKPGYRDVPLLVKISPDNSNEQIDDILNLVEQYHLAGIVATNTTIARDNLVTVASKVEEMGAGGLSGKPVQKRSDEVVSYIRQRNSEIVLIGVGGIKTGEDARNKMKLGANLVQVYSCFIYAGPRMISDITHAIH